MPLSTKRTRRASAALSFAALLLSGTACEIGGGLSDHSVTVPGEDGVYLKAEATSAHFPAKLELERSTRTIVNGHERHYVFSKTLVEQELRLAIGAGHEDATFTIAEHNEASSFEEHGLEISSDGTRVAYKLGANPWRFIYVLTPDFAAHGPFELAGDLDWTKVPSLDDAFVSVYSAQRLRLDGTHSFNKMTPMLEWLAENRGEGVLLDILFGMLGPKRDYDWDQQLRLLSSQGRESLAERIVEEVRTGAPAPSHYRQAWLLGRLELAQAENIEVVRRGTSALARDEETLANKGDALAAYLLALTQHDAAAASKIACPLLLVADPPYALHEGREARVAAEAACRK